MKYAPLSFYYIYIDITDQAKDINSQAKDIHEAIGSIHTDIEKELISKYKAGGIDITPADLNELNSTNAF